MPEPSPQLEPEQTSVTPLTSSQSAGSLGDASQATPAESSGSDQWQAEHPRISDSIKKHKAFYYGRMALIGLTIILLVAIAYVRWRQGAFDQSRVGIKVEAPEAIDASQDMRVTVSYLNNNRVALKDMEVRVYYPEDFHLGELAPGMTVEGEYIKVSLGKIAAFSSGKFDVVGYLTGASQTVGYMKAVASYTPENVSSQYESSGQTAILLQSSSLSLDVEAPLEIASDMKAEYVISYSNVSDSPLTNVRIKASYPEGFTFMEANPPPSEGDGVWYLGTVQPHQSGKINTWGVLKGEKGEIKKFHIDAGKPRGDGNLAVFAMAERTTKMVSSPLEISQIVNGVNKTTIDAGGALRYTLSYRNNGPIPLRNAVITFEMRSRVLDFSQMKNDGGTFDQKTQTMVWRASDIPALANLSPGATGNINVTIPVMGGISFQSDNEKNPTVVTIAKIDSPDLPNPSGANKIVGSNTLTVPVNTTPSLVARTSYKDTTFTNTGPTPPVVGQETTYTVFWTLGNTTSSLKESRVVGKLSPNVRWIGQVSPGGEPVTFNERTNEIVWEVGALESGAGGIRPSRAIAFQIGLTPAPNQANNLLMAPLLDSAVLSGVDAFTGEKLTVPFKSKIGAPLE